MMNLLPYIAKAFALLVPDEKQREFKSNNQMFTEASSMNASSSMNSASSSGSSEGRQQFKTNYASTSSHNGRPRIFCDYCRRLRHIRDKCFKLHGYPQTNTHGNDQTRYNNSQNQRFEPHNNQPHRSAKGKGIAANAFGIDDETTAAHIDEHPHISSPNIIKDQYGQLLSLLQQFQRGPTGETNEDQGASGFQV